MQRYEKLKLAARYYLQGAQMFEALDALEYGYEVHDGFRKDGVTPEYMHQIQIFHYLRTMEPSLLYPEATYVAAFLHDAPEDKIEVTQREIRQRYSAAPADAIELLNKSGLDLPVYIDRLSNHPIGSIVKLADRINNMSTMTNVFTREKQLRYVDEVETLFMPMIKHARRKFPVQEAAYENAKTVLNIQLDLLEVINRSE